MLRGLYTAAAGMITQQRKHDTATNNLAHMNTPGFKQGVTVSRSFPEMMIHIMNSGEATPSRQIGRLNTGVMAEETMFPILQGDLFETGKTTDFAIVSNIQLMDEDTGEPIRFDESGKFVNEDGETIFQPQAFFTVWDENDELRYTRNGTFVINNAGELTTAAGHRVLDRNEQPIVFGPEWSSDRLRVDSRGLLYDAQTGEALLNEDGEQIGLLITQVNNPNLLVRIGDSLFRLELEDNPDLDIDDVIEPVENMDNVQIFQGFIERSNVDPIQATTSMMVAMRAYEANQRIIQFYDQTLEKTVNEIGRV